MGFETIRKAAPPGVVPNLRDFDEGRRDFSWAAAQRALDGLPGGRGLNIAHEAVDRHVRGGRGTHVAVRCLGASGAVTDLTYADLQEQTNRFANVLRALAVGRGDRVFLLAGRVPELYVGALGALKIQGVVAPLFSAFGPEPVRQRIERGDGRVLVTTPALYRRKVAPVRAALPGLRHVLLVGAPAEVAQVEGVLDLHALMAAAAPEFEIPPTDPEDMALLHLTSGTTGTPNGAVHVHAAVIAHHATGRLALDLHDDDVFWCTADPGWVTGTSYEIIAPLTVGVTSLVDEAEFDARRWYRTLERERVTVWYTAPTAVRMLMRAGVGLAHEHDLSGLRFVASVGEPLNPEAVVWGSMPSTGRATTLVADRDRRNNDLQLRRDGHPAGVDGSPAAGRRGGDPRRGHNGRALVENGRVRMAEMFGKVTGCSRGRGGSMHLFDAATRFCGGNAIVGGGLPLAVGLALADRMRGLDRVTACFFGEGAVAEGEFHESVNLAALWRRRCCSAARTTSMPWHRARSLGVAHQSRGQGGQL